MKKRRKREPMVRKSPGFSIYISLGLHEQMTQFRREHPEVSLSRICSGYLSQYLHDQGYPLNEKEAFTKTEGRPTP